MDNSTYSQWPSMASPIALIRWRRETHGHTVRAITKRLAVPCLNEIPKNYKRPLEFSFFPSKMKTAIYLLAFVSAVIAQTPRVVDQVADSVIWNVE